MRRLLSAYLTLSALLTLSLLLTLLTTATVFSQQVQSQSQDSLSASDQPKYTLTPIVVTATRSERPILRVPYAIDVIEKKEIQRAEVGFSLNEALRTIPGVVVNNCYNQNQGDRISMRGIGIRAAFGVRGMKIILDGIPLTVPDGTSMLENLDIASVGRIEILRGLSSSLYGNAAGGLINIQTQSASPMPFLFQPRFLVGSDGLQRWQSKISGTIGRHAYFINANKLNLDGYREHSSGSSIAINAVGQHDISNNIRLTSVFNYYDAPYLLSPSSLSKTDATLEPTKARYFVIQQGSGKQARQGQGGITLKYQDDNTNQFRTTIYGLSRSILGATPGTIFESNRTSGGMRTVFSRRFQLRSSQLRWTIGTDVEAQTGTQVEYDNLGLPEDQVEIATGSNIFELLQYGSRFLDQDEKVLNIGPFSELEFAFNSHWILTLGQRYDYYKFEVDDHFMEDGFDDSGSRNMDKFSPMIGIIFRPLDYIKLYSNYSSAFQTPTTNELRNRPTGEGGFNPTLEPEIMRGFEFGLSGLWPERRLEYDVSLYYVSTEDMLIPYQLQDVAREEDYFRNAGKTKNKGAEIKINWIPTKGLKAGIAYTYMNFTFKDYEVEISADDTVQRFQLAGNEVPGAPPQQLFTGITYEHEIGAYSEISLRWMDEYFANDLNGPEPGGDKPVHDFVNDAYLTVDMRFAFQHRFAQLGIEFFGGINNLFDKRYNASIVPNAFGDRFFLPAPRRSWYTGVSISFPGNGAQR